MVYRFKHLHKGERVNKPIFNSAILFLIAQLVIELTRAITSAYYSAQTRDMAQWIRQVMLDKLRWQLVFVGKANTSEGMKHKGKDVKNVMLREKHIKKFSPKTKISMSGYFTYDYRNFPFFFSCSELVMVAALC